MEVRITKLEAGKMRVVLRDKWSGRQACIKTDGSRRVPRDKLMPAIEFVQGSRPSPEPS